MPEETDNAQVLIRLREADRTHQLEQGQRFLLRSVKYFALALVILFALDVVFHLSAQLRLTQSLAFLAALALVFAGAFYLALVKTNPLEKIARLLEDRETSLGSKLINILQLRDEAKNPEHSDLRRSLARRAIDEAAVEVQHVDFKPIVKTPQRKKRDFFQAAGVTTLLVALLAVFHGISGTELLRFLDPFGDHPPYSFTSLEIVEPLADGQHIPYKGNTVVEVAFGGHRPSDVFLSAYDPADPSKKETTIPMIGKADAGFVQQLDHITTDLVIYAHTKSRNSRSKQRRLNVLLTPKLEKAFLTVTPPAYTNLETRERTYQFTETKALKGSELTFALRSNRPLSGGSIEFVLPQSEAPVLIPLTPDPDIPEIVRGTFPAQSSGHLSFSLKDIDSIPSDDEMSASLTVTHDLGPTVSITQPPQDSFIVENHKFDIVVDAADDYGIAKIRVHRALNETYSLPREVPLDKPRRNARHAMTVDLPRLGVTAGDIISLFAEAIDSHPHEPHLARSEVRHLMVITEQEYNDYLREQLDMTDMSDKYTALLDQFDQLVAQQEEISQQLKALQQQQQNAATPEEQDALQKQIDALQQQQADLNESFKEFADAMENFVRDSPVYDVEEQIDEALAERAQDIRDSVAQNEQDMSPAGPGLQSIEDFKDASDDQLERLTGAREQAEEQVSEPLQDLADLHEIMKDFNQFKALYDQQEAIAAQSQPYKDRNDLSQEDRLALQNLAAREKQVGAMLDALAEKAFADADAAEENFPKAAQSARDLAHLIEAARMPHIAGQGARKMLEGDGPQSHQLAERLRQEMEKLFSEGQQGGGGQSLAQSFDTYMQLMKVPGGDTFNQMKMCRKFGFGPGKGQGRGIAQGMGAGGGSGQMMSPAPNIGMMGGEPDIQNANRGQGPGQRNRTPDSIADNASETGANNSPQSTTSSTRDSGPVNSETILDQYRGLVEEYFRTITTQPEPDESRTP